MTKRPVGNIIPRSEVIVGEIQHMMEKSNNYSEERLIEMLEKHGDMTLTQICEKLGLYVNGGWTTTSHRLRDRGIIRITPRGKSNILHLIKK